MFIYDLSRCGFQSRCSHPKLHICCLLPDRNSLSFRPTIEYGFTLKLVHDMIITSSVIALCIYVFDMDRLVSCNKLDFCHHFIPPKSSPLFLLIQVIYLNLLLALQVFCFSLCFCIKTNSWKKCHH